jgi:hypothetical protein
MYGHPEGKWPSQEFVDRVTNEDDGPNVIGRCSTTLHFLVKEYPWLVNLLKEESIKLYGLTKENTRQQTKNSAEQETQTQATRSDDQDK